jgi:hypothetical protein
MLGENIGGGGAEDVRSQKLMCFSLFQAGIEAGETENLTLVV